MIEIGLLNASCAGMVIGTLLGYILEEVTYDNEDANFKGESE